MDSTLRNIDTRSNPLYQSCCKATASCKGLAHAGNTSEAGGAPPQVVGKVEYEIICEILILRGFAFYGGASITTPVEMLIDKQELGLNKKNCHNIAIPIYCLTGSSTGTFTATGIFGSPSFIVTVTDHDIYSVKLSFALPTDRLAQPRTFTFAIQQPIYKCESSRTSKGDECESPMAQGFDAMPLNKSPCKDIPTDRLIQQFGPAFLHDQNLFNQEYAIAVGPRSVLIMTNSTLVLFEKEYPYKILDRIYTQGDGGSDAFWPFPVDVEYSRPFNHRILYDTIAQRFVIIQVRWLVRTGNDIYTNSDLVFAVSKSSHPTFSDKSWCKFVFDRRRTDDDDNNNIAVGIQLSYDKNAYYVAENLFINEGTAVTRLTRLFTINKEQIECNRPLVIRELLTVEGDDFSRITLVQMLTPSRFVYAIGHVDNTPLVLYRLTETQVKSRLLPITLGTSSRGAAVARESTLWFSYNSANNIIWYEVHIKNLTVVQSHTINTGTRLLNPAIMVDKHHNVLLEFVIFANDITSLAYVWNDSKVIVARQGTQSSELEGGTNLWPWSSIDPCNDTTIYGFGAFQARTGNWQSFIIKVNSPTTH